MGKFGVLAFKCIAIIVLLNYRHKATYVPWNDKLLCRLYNRQLINSSGNWQAVPHYKAFVSSVRIGTKKAVGSVSRIKFHYIRTMTPLDPLKAKSTFLISVYRVT